MMFSAMIFPRLADIFGRKKIYLLGLFSHTICLLSILNAKSIYQMYVLITIQGMTAVAKDQVAYVYMMELLPYKDQIFAGTVLFVLDGMTIAISSFLFAFFTKDWRSFQYFNLILSIFLCSVAIWIPESPRYLHSKNNFGRARKVLTYISIRNKVLRPDQKYNRTFVEEQARQAETSE